MPTIEATVQFKTYVSDSDTKGSRPYDIIKSRIHDARDISVTEFRIEP